MRSYILIVVIIIMSIHSSSAQLSRRAFLGTALSTVNDSIANIYHLPEAKGALIDLVVSNSSAEAMGLLPGDVIATVMGKYMNNRDDVISTIGQYRAGDKISIEYYRHGELQSSQVILKAFPYEISDYADVIYDAVAHDGGFVRTIVRKPRGEGPFPALFFIQGAHCGSMERMDQRNPVAKLIEGLAKEGYVVIKTEKAGVGDSQNQKDCSKYNLLEEVRLFEASFNHLARYDFIDQDNVFIFGHSMGGIQAPLMQTDFDPKGIAVFGTVARPWFEYFLEIVRKQRLLLGQDYLENEQIHEHALRFFYSLMIEKKTPEEIKSDKKLHDFMANQWNYDGRENFHGRHYTFWQQLQDARLFSAWAKTQAHVLSIWGEGEFVAINPYEHQLIADIVNHYNPGKAQFVRMPNIDHGFVRVDDLQHAIEVRSDWQYQYSNFNDEIVTLLHDWMQEVMAGSPTLHP
jgi:uncharacterized protein